MRLEHALDCYLLQLRADGRSPHTVHQYRRHIRLLGRWLETEGRDLEVEAIDHEVLALFFVSDAATKAPDGRPKRATSMNALRSSIRTFFSHLHALGAISTNSARLVRRARCGTPPPRALSEEEQVRLLAVLDMVDTTEARRDRALVRLLLGSGLRIGTALSLNVEDVELDAGELTLRAMKGDRPDILPLAPTVVTLLKDFIADRTAGPLFTGRGGRRITTRHAARRFQAWCRKAGIHRSASPHSLRHSFATRLLRKTGDLALVRDALLHRSIASTLIYAKCGTDRLRAALA